jgi:hypothetical protein
LALELREFLHNQGQKKTFGSFDRLTTSAREEALALGDNGKFRGRRKAC